MKSKFYKLILVLNLFLSCKQEKVNTDCNFIKEINEITLSIRYSTSINNIHKRFIEIRKLDSINFDFSEISYGFTTSGNDTLIRENLNSIYSYKFTKIKELISNIDEAKLSNAPTHTGFDGSFYKLKYGDRLNFKHFNFQSPYSSRRKNMDEFKAVIDEILKLTPNPNLKI